MKSVLTFICRAVALLLIVVFVALTFDWLVSFVACILDSPYRGAFFTEVWGAVSILYSWLPDHTLTRLIGKIAVAILIIVVPACLAVASYIWYDRNDTFVK